MNPIICEELEQELKQMKEYVQKLEKSLKNAPEGTLRTKMSRGKFPEYYYSDPKNQVKNEYLTKKRRNLAEALAQKEYDRELLSLLEARIRTIDKLKNLYSVSIEEKYEQLTEARKLLVKPLILPESEFVESWKKQFVVGKNSYPIEGGIYTENGELVRSKTEKIIADKLFYREIPYVYEPVLSPDEYTTFFPDFAILNKRTRETFYYEHFGMMDDPEYSRKAVLKIERYHASGFWFGDNLLYSFETKEHPVNLVGIDRMLAKYLI